MTDSPTVSEPTPSRTHAPGAALVLALFFCSGFAALVYEVAWVRLLTRLLGHSQYSVTAVLAAYMGGLALGSWVIGRRVDRSRRALAWYGMLELAVALAAVLVPFAVGGLESAYAALYRHAEDATVTLGVVRALFALSVLLVPTFLLGGSFPALAAVWMGRGEGSGRRAGWLYGVNTLGAVAGCLCAGFLLMEAAGVRGATWIAAAVSAGVGVVALVTARRLDAATPDATPPVPEVVAPSPVESSAPMTALPTAPELSTQALLIAAFGSGLVGLALEVLWTRVLALFFTSITYAFSAMLAVFLTGIALGGLVGGWLADRVAQRARLLTYLLFALGITAAVSLQALSWVDPGRTGTHAAAFGGPDWLGYVGWTLRVSLMVMLPATLCLGAIFPILLRCAGDAPNSTPGAASGRIYAANALGAIVGPPLATWILLPWLNSLATSIAAVAVVAFGLGGWFGRSGRARTVSLCAAVALSVLAIVFAAGWTTGGIDGLYGHRFRGGQKILYHEEGPTTTVTVVEQRGTEGSPGRRWLYTDSFLVAGVSPDYAYMRMLGHLPALLAPEPRRALVVGFGTGTTAGALSLHPFERLDIVEIAPEILRSAAWFESVNRGVAAGKVARPEVRIHREDGRNHLLGTSQDYDVITAEPPLPYLAGAVNLYSRDFYEACRARLSANGVLCQWMPMHGVRPEHYRQMLASFRDVFPAGTLWYFRSSAIAIGTLRPLVIDYTALTQRLEASPAVLANLAQEGLGSATAILAGHLLDAAGLETFTAGTPVCTDDRPSLEFFGRGDSVAQAFPTNMRALLALRAPLAQTLVLPTESPMREFIAGRVDRAFEAGGKGILGYTLEMEGKFVEAAAEYQAALARNPEDRAVRAMYAENLARLNRMGLQAPAGPGGKPKDGAKPRVKLEGLLADLQKEDAQRRMDALYSLGEQEERTALPQVLEKLKDPAAQVRLAAVWALGRIGGEAELAMLEEIRLGRDPEISVMALSSLVQLGREEHLNTLQKMVRDIDPKVRAAAMAALLNLQGRVAGIPWDWIDERLTDRDQDVRKLAVMICGKLRDPARIPALRNALKTTDWMMRAWVTVALGEIGHRDGVAILLTCLDDSDSFVRKKAGEAIQLASGGTLPFDPDAEDAVRARQVAAWKTWWQERQ